jgi:hypothetical protein
MAVLSARSQATGLQASRRSFAAVPVARPLRNVVVRAEEGTATAAPAAKPVWTVPTLDPDTPAPIFGGSTGGLLRKAQVPIPGPARARLPRLPRPASRIPLVAECESAAPAAG